MNTEVTHALQPMGRSRPPHEATPKADPGCQMWRRVPHNSPMGPRILFLLLLAGLQSCTSSGKPDDVPLELVDVYMEFPAQAPLSARLIITTNRRADVMVQVSGDERNWTATPEMVTVEPGSPAAVPLVGGRALHTYTVTVTATAAP